MGKPFVRVVDPYTGCRVRALWRRGRLYYAQLSVPTPDGKRKVRKIRLRGRSLAQARRAIETLRVERDRGRVVVAGADSPRFSDVRAAYQARGRTHKAPDTRRNEDFHLRLFETAWPAMRIEQIQLRHVNAYVADRRPRTCAAAVNNELATLRAVLRHAASEGHSVMDPRLVRNLPQPRPARRLLDRAEIDRVVEALRAQRTPTSRQAADMVLFMAFSGARYRETLDVRWDDVDLGRGLLTLGASGHSKSRRARAVNMNPALIELLPQITRRSPLVFPLAQRSMGVREAIWRARAAAGVPWFTPHLLRHWFVSQCVMGGIDYMTIARWAGHRDGGVLIGRVYGHLTDQHARAAAGRLRL